MASGIIARYCAIVFMSVLYRATAQLDQYSGCSPLNQHMFITIKNAMIDQNSKMYTFQGTYDKIILKIY